MDPGLDTGAFCGSVVVETFDACEDNLRSFLVFAYNHVLLIVLKNTIHKIHRRLRSSMLNRGSGSRVLGCPGNVYPTNATR